MRCKYCFYRDVSERRECESYGVMTREVLEAFLKNVFAYAREPISFTFQGGEPTLAGVEYFKNFHSLVGKYNIRSLPISYSLQTNGYDIPDELCEIFARYRYLLGVSLDGDAALHDSLRLGAGGEPTFDKIRATVRRFDEYKIDYNILTVITEGLARRGADVYKYLRDNGFKYVQFIPFIPDFSGDGEGEEYTLTNEGYARFLNETFIEYHRDFISGRYVSVRQFDNFVRIAAGLGAECCGMGGSCVASLVVEADGGVYPCDFYVLDRWRMGNITTDSIGALLSSEAAKSFVKLSRELPAECSSCEYLPICRGGCRRHRECAEGLSQNRYCSAYRKFFTESTELILDIANRIKIKNR